MSTSRQIRPPPLFLVRATHVTGRDLVTGAPVTHTTTMVRTHNETWAHEIAAKIRECPDYSETWVEKAP
jgi:hypothetical protein